jgi:LacI family transcriptional regulator
MLNRRREHYHRRAGKFDDRPRKIAQPHRLQVEQVAGLDSVDIFICEDRLVIEAMRFIASNLRQDLKIDDVAEHLGTSRETLMRRFKTVLGRSVMKEVNRQRVEKLKQDLAQTGRSIGEISKEFGFSSAGQLSRYFKREVGVSPSDYRRGKRVPTAEMTFFGGGTTGSGRKGAGYKCRTNRLRSMN